MSDGPPDANQHEGELQFDRAEPGDEGPPEPLACTGCGRPIEDAYYEVNGQVRCGVCCEQMRAARFGGSRAARVARAMAFGVLAGAVGAGIYYAVAALTGYEIGLVALIVGLLVGGAVRLGSNARGGWFYQCLAMFLTYAAIGVSYSLFMIQAVAEDPSLLEPNTPAVSTARATAGTDAAVPAVESRPVEDSKQPVESLSTGEKVVGVGLALVFMLFILLALPILVGFEAPLALLILAIALYEAWKINKRQPLQISGPYSIGSDVSDHPAAASPESSDE